MQARKARQDTVNPQQLFHFIVNVDLFQKPAVQEGAGDSGDGGGRRRGAGQAAAGLGRPGSCGQNTPTESA